MSSLILTQNGLSTWAFQSSVLEKVIKISKVKSGHTKIIGHWNLILSEFTNIDLEKSWELDNRECEQVRLECSTKVSLKL